MLQGFRKSKPSSDSRLPITPTILKKIIHALEFSTTSAFTKSLFRAMFTLAFCAFLRVGELTKTNAPTKHFLLFGNITLGSDSPCNRYIDINIPHFKHSKANTTTLRLQQNTTDPLVCPCQALLHYLNLRKHSSPSEPLFSFMDGSPISRQYFTQQLRSALAFCNLDLHLYKAHSFRIGAATTAASQGFSELQIQSMGRWNSGAFKKYIRIPTLKF